LVAQLPPSFPTRRSSDLPAVNSFAASHPSLESRSTSSAVRSGRASLRRSSASTLSAPPPSTVHLASRFAQTQLEFSRASIASEGDRKSTRLNSSHVKISY